MRMHFQKLNLTVLKTDIYNENKNALQEILLKSISNGNKKTLSAYATFANEKKNVLILCAGLTNRFPVKYRDNKFWPYDRYERESNRTFWMWYSFGRSYIRIIITKKIVFASVWVSIRIEFVSRTVHVVACFGLSNDTQSTSKQGAWFVYVNESA